MALPLLPTHDTCPKPLKTEVLDKDFAEPEKKPNPFSVLQGLKTKSWVQFSGFLMYFLMSHSFTDTIEGFAELGFSSF